MPIVNGVKAAHHMYVVPGLVDGDVCRQQSQQRWDQLAETSVVHWHDSKDECGKSRHDVYGDVEYVESSQG